jgi:hypothetical protein
MLRREHIVAEADNDYTNHAWYVIRRELSWAMKWKDSCGWVLGSSSSFLYSRNHKTNVGPLIKHRQRRRNQINLPSSSSFSCRTRIHHILYFATGKLSPQTCLIFFFPDIFCAQLRSLISQVLWDSKWMINSLAKFLTLLHDQVRDKV